MMSEDAKTLFRLAAGFGYASGISGNGSIEQLIEESETAIHLLDGCNSINEMIEVAGILVEAMRHHGRIGKIN